MKSFSLSLFILSIVSFNLYSKLLIVGNNETYQSVQQAARDAYPGDTILVKAGLYSGGMFISNLKGSADKFIRIIGEPNQEVIIQGGTNSIQFSDPEYISLENLTFQGQTGNGLNIDDAGDYTTPATNIIIKNCVFRDINASGNNDLLKLSGVDHFVVENCIFLNGAAGGSGIDMVGCHNGIISSCKFKNMGSNAIQAKGGSQFIEIYANYFENCGQRTLNLGGSTGLNYFRPIDAKFEAADLKIYCNIFIGSVAPICYVGCVGVEVINNTIINPEKWAIRILQETVDESRFEKCGNNSFLNNIIYIGNLSTETNIGPNTAPETFTFRNNFWYNYQNPNWSGPRIPVNDPDQMINLSPNFEDFDAKDFRLRKGSPAIGIINYTGSPNFDYFGNQFKNPRSAGAIEFIEPASKIEHYESNVSIFPNPASDYIEIFIESFPLENGENGTIKIYNTFGECVLSVNAYSNMPLHRIDVSNLPFGLYFIQIGNYTEKFGVMR